MFQVNFNVSFVQKFTLWQFNIINQEKNSPFTSMIYLLNVVTCHSYHTNCRRVNSFDEFDQGIVVTSPEKVSGGEQISSFLLGDGEKLGMLFIIYI